MASLEIKTWTKDGRRMEASRYTVHVFFERRRYKLPGFDTNAAGRRMSEELGRNVEKLLMHLATGGGVTA